MIEPKKLYYWGWVVATVLLMLFSKPIGSGDVLAVINLVPFILFVFLVVNYPVFFYPRYASPYDILNVIVFILSFRMAIEYFTEIIPFLKKSSELEKLFFAIGCVGIYVFLTQFYLKKLKK